MNERGWNSYVCFFEPHLCADNEQRTMTSLHLEVRQDKQISRKRFIFLQTQFGDMTIPPSIGELVENKISPINNSTDSLGLNVVLPNRTGEMKADGSGIDAKHEGILVIPSPGFTLKTQSYKNVKVFINVCYNDMIEKKSMKKKLDDSGKEIEGLNIPISMGAMRTCDDKAGNSCVVVDAIVHTSIEDDIRNDKSGYQRDVVCQVLMNCFDQKYPTHAPLDKRYKLPKMKYIGFVDTRDGSIIRKQSEHSEVCKQMVKDTRLIPKIEEIQSTKNESQNELNFPSFSIFVIITETEEKGIDEYIKLVGGECEMFHLNAWNKHIPLCLNSTDIHSFPTHIVIRATAKSIEIDAMKMQLSSFVLTAQLGEKKIDTVLPFSVDTRDVDCVYDEDQSELKLTCKIVSSPIGENPDPGSHQWSFAQGIAKNEKSKSKSSSKPNGLPETSEVKEDHDPYHLQPVYKWKQNSSMSHLDSKDETLPEDGFHEKDCLSQYIMQKQEEERREKIERHENENHTMKNHPDFPSESKSLSYDHLPMTDADLAHEQMLREIELILKEGDDFFENDLWYRLL